LNRYFGQLIGRVSLALRSVPGVHDLAELALAVGVLGLAAGVLLSASGLIHWSPRTPPEILVLAVRALFIPALGEELVFRAALVPSRGSSVNAVVPIAASTTLFTLWHIVETTFLRGSATTFLRPDFLAFAATLGLACALLRYRSRSIWTAVALHWSLVVAWQGWFGGPSFGAA
jgi:predicted Abi (CAAX) family protease